MRDKKHLQHQYAILGMLTAIPNLSIFSYFTTKMPTGDGFEGLGNLINGITLFAITVILVVIIVQIYKLLIPKFEKDSLLLLFTAFFMIVIASFMNYFICQQMIRPI